MLDRPTDFRGLLETLDAGGVEFDQDLLRASLCGLLLFLATPAMAQVQVEAYLEKSRYLAGEPIVVVVDVLNVGDEPVGYETGQQDVSLTITGAQRRVPPNIFGCFSAMGSGGRYGGIAHPPLLAPGQRTSFRYLLKDYDLAPGDYRLSASGRPSVRWKYYPLHEPNRPPPPPRKHKEGDSVPGAHFERTFSFTVEAGTEDELMRAFAPLVMDADGADLARRYQARAAIIESAPAFLDSLIGRFAAESQGDWSAIEALGRLATGTSRMYLRALFRSGDVSRRQGIALALARVGHSDDAAFLADVLQDATVEERSRSYAALGLGRIGGDQSVGLLEGALSGAPAEIRSSIATALGNTRSRAAVPILISLSGNNPAHNDVCGALKTLTHRTWCDGSYGDPAAKQRRWQRWWTTNGSNATMFGPDNCPVPPEDVVPAPVVEPVTVAGMPLIASVHPAATAPNTIVSITGFFLGLEDTRLMRVLFVREHVEIVGAIDSTGRVISDAPDGGLQYMSVVVPKALTFGTWHVVIHAHGRTSVPVALEITAVPEVKLIRVLPERPHPAQLVSIATRAGAQVDDEVELTDARGTRWRLLAGVSSDDLLVALPDEIADGQATVRVVGTDHGVERLSAPLKFWVTSGPLPLKAFAVERMTPAAPGQWTDLAVDNEIEFEVGRADRIDVDFRQGNETFITQATEPDGVHVQVPVGLAPGVAWVRTRTWIEQTASEWSPRGRFRVLDRPK